MKMALTCILLLLCFLVEVFSSESASRTSHVCFHSDNSAEWQVNVPVSEADQGTSFQCFHPSDTLTPPDSTNAFVVGPDGRCNESESVPLTDIAPTASVTNQLGNMYWFRTRVLPFDGPKTFCYVCSGDPAHETFKGKKCFVFLQVAQAELTTHATCNRAAYPAAVRIDPAASSKMITFQCGSTFPNLQPSLDSGEVLAGPKCDKTVALETVLPGAALSQVVGSDSASRAYKLEVSKLPTTEQVVCVKCSNKTAGNVASDECLVRIVVPPPPTQ
ncbi:sag-related sequence srs60a [Cystoisospora suis]|uniref:Sag-related sequence srs60a n=1 Tax=Cystoisospora suis TaxID=483139 RepID=A0A2C6KP17_9APIC|nr:sag-related sequence srs60a [Cystoisospora suis]